MAEPYPTTRKGQLCATPCSRCGTPTDIHVGDRAICENCYADLASCCAGELEPDPKGPPISESAAHESSRQTAPIQELR